MPSRAIDIAQYFLSLAADEAEPEPITPFRVQKLLYYAQGLSLAYRNRPLFADVIQAWQHGPVVPAVWYEFASFSGASIPLGAIKSLHLANEDEEFISSVWEEYRKYSAAELRRMTHNEPPWRETRRGLADNVPSKRPITIERLKRYFDAMCDSELRAKSGISMSDIRQGQADSAEGRMSSWDDVRRRLVKSA